MKEPKAQVVRDNIIRLFDSQDDDVPDMPLGRPHLMDGSAHVPPQPPAVDLSEKPRLILVFGAGRSGKSLMLRYATERAFERDDGQPLYLATLDVERPTLWQFFADTMFPKSVGQAQSWLEKLFASLMEKPTTTAIDFPADMTMTKLVTQVPNLLETLEQAGLAVVALYMLTPRSADLSVLQAMEDCGFQPKATALILNLGTTDSQDPDLATLEFRTIRRHLAYQGALKRGAMEIFMPRLYAAKAVEDRLLSFQDAMDGKGSPPLGLFDRSRVFGWRQTQMPAALAPIRTWLP
jgi:hypothetical protein